MQVLHLSTSDAVGGAARAAFRLHDGLLRRGLESEMLVLNKTVVRPEIHRFVPSRSSGDRLARRVRRLFFSAPRTDYPLGADSLDVFSRGRSYWGDELLRQATGADVVNLHWSVGMFEYDGLAGLKQTVWTLHDMHPFTGGCHFDDGCGRYRQSCGSCPQLRSRRDDDDSRRLWRRRRAALETIAENRLTIVAPSRWLADAARQSKLFSRFRVEVIPYGLDTDVFCPRDRSVAREALGIPTAARVVLFVCDRMANRRKGFSLLLDALSRLGNVPNLWLLSIGNGERLAGTAFPHRHIPFIDDDRLLSVFYSAADLFVIPSIQDNLPNTALEATACGVPIVGFDVGGIPDIVQGHRNGRAVPVGDTAAMAAAIHEILGDAERRRVMAEEARAIAISQFSLETQASRYESLYRERLQTSSPAALNRDAGRIPSPVS